MRVREYLGIPYFVDDGPPYRVWGIDDVENRKMIGTIKTMPPKKGFCFVVAPNGKEYFLHRSEFHGFWDDLELDFNNTDNPIEISFDEVESAKGPRASNAIRNAWPNERT